MSTPVQPGTKVTEEQAGQALQDLIAGQNGGGTAEVELEGPELVDPDAPAEPEVTPTGEPEPQGDEQPQGDDVDSLKQRVTALTEELEQGRKKHADQLTAVQTRFAQSEQILRDRHLRKSTVADNALKVLRKVRTEAGAAPDEIDRLIAEMEGTMHPSSTSYAPQATPPRPAANEDQAIVLNAFLNEQGMTMQEAEEFGKWIQTKAGEVMSQAELAVADHSLDGFLRLAHGRFRQSLTQQDKNKRRDDVVTAVRAVQVNQRSAARASSASPGALRKPMTNGASNRNMIDVAKLTNDDIAKLLVASVEQNR